MDPILLVKPELVRFRAEGAYRAWEQGQSSSQVAVQRPRRVRQIIFGLRGLAVTRQHGREARRVVMALNDKLSGS